MQERLYPIFIYMFSNYVVHLKKKESFPYSANVVPVSSQLYREREREREREIGGERLDVCRDRTKEHPSFRAHA